MSDSNSAQYRAIQNLQDKLVEAITCTQMLDTSIQRIFRISATFKSSTARGKASTLVSALVDKVEQDSTEFEKLLNILKEFSSLEHLVKLLENEVVRVSKLANTTNQFMTQDQGESHSSSFRPQDYMCTLEPVSNTYESGFGESSQDLEPIAGEQIATLSGGASASGDVVNSVGTNLFFAFSPPLPIPLGNDCEKQKEDSLSSSADVLNDCEERKEDSLSAPTADTQPPGEPTFHIGPSLQELAEAPGSALNDLRKAEDRIAVEISSKDKKISELEKKVIKKDEELKRVKEEKAKLEDTLKQKVVENNSLNEKLRVKEEMIEQQRGRLSSTEKKNKDLRDYYEAKIKKLEEEKKMDILVRTEERHKLEIEIKDMETKEQRLLAEIAGAKKESSDIKAELALERQKIAEEKRSESETKLEEMERECEKLRTQLSRASLSSNASAPSLDSQYSVQSPHSSHSSMSPLNTQVSVESSLSTQASVEPSLGTQASVMEPSLGTQAPVMEPSLGTQADKDC